MNNKQISAMALKVFAIYILAQLIIQLPSVYGVFLSISHWVGPNIEPIIWIPIILLFATFIVVAILARLFWNLSNDIIEKAVSNSSAEQPANMPDDFHEFIIFVLGMFILIQGLFGLPYPLTSAFHEIAGYPNTGGLSGDTVVWFLSEVLLAILGLSLIFKRKNWVDFYQRLKYAGTDK